MTEDIDQCYAKYPYFDTLRDTLADDIISFPDLGDEPDSDVLERAQERISTAVTDGKIGKRSTFRSTELLSYPTAGILLSLLDSQPLIDQYAIAEANTARANLANDIPKTTDNPMSTATIQNNPNERAILNEVGEPEQKDGVHFGEVADEFDLDLTYHDPSDLFSRATSADHWNDADPDTRRTILNDLFPNTTHSDVADTSWSDLCDTVLTDAFDLSEYHRFSIPLTDYLDIHPDGDDDRWHLSNRVVFDGRVLLDYDDTLDIFAALIEADIQNRLPKPLPPDIHDDYFEAAAKLRSHDDLNHLFDTVDLTAFPLLDLDVLANPYFVETTDDYEELGRGHDDLDLDTIRQHYADATDIYTALGTLADHDTSDETRHTSWLGAQEHAGWYVSGSLASREDAPEAWDHGFPRYSRPSILPTDFEALSTGRSVYTTNTYAPRSAFATRYYKLDDSGNRVWMDDVIDISDEDDETEDADESEADETEDDDTDTNDEDDDESTSIKRLPDYDELGAYALIVDIDLEDEYKNRPLPDDHQRVVEQRLNAWVDAFAALLGGSRDDVFVVDSGGGAYVMTPPAALAPLIDEYDGEDLYAINRELNSRMRELTRVLDDIITGTDAAPTEMFSADAVQNKNRQWKTLLSVHADLDAVVHPIDPLDIEYDVTRLDNVDDDLRAEARKWATQFTADTSDYRSYIDPIVKTLFKRDVFEHADSNYPRFEGDDWTEILDAFLEDYNAEQEARQAAIERRKKLGMGDVGVTTNKYDVDAAIAAVDLASYLREYAQNWGTDNRADDTVSFSPSGWRNPSSTANSCFYDPNGGSDGSPVFTDRKEGFTAGIIDLIAYSEGITNTPAETPSGGDWWDAVQALRDYGEAIPILLPDITDDDYSYDKLGVEQLVRAALALDVCSEDDIETKDGEYGEYRDFKNAEDYNETLDELEARDIEHGRQRRT